MSLLDSFLDTKITDSKSKINYKPSNIDIKSGRSKENIVCKTSKELLKNTGNAIKDVYNGRVLWCKSFYKTDIYYKCVNEISKQLYSYTGETIGVIPTLIELSFANDYWFGDIQKKYTPQQLRRIERELDDGKTSEDLCYEMLYFAWNKIRIKEDCDYVLTESDVFKIKNRAKGEESGK